MPRRNKPQPPDRAREALDAGTKPKRPDPSASPSGTGTAPTAAAIHRPPSERHGPQAPRPKPYGVDRLRAAMNLSTDVSIPDLCDQAARELESLRDRVPPLPWPDTPRRASIDGLHRV